MPIGFDKDSVSSDVSHLITKQDAEIKYVNSTGDVMSGNLDMNSNKIVNLGIPVSNDQAASKVYVDTINKDSFKIIQNRTVDMKSMRLDNLALSNVHLESAVIANPVNPTDVANKVYCDSLRTTHIEVRKKPQWNKTCESFDLRGISLASLVDLRDYSEREANLILKENLLIEISAFGDYHVDSLNNSKVGTYPLKTFLTYSYINHQDKTLTVRVEISKDYSPANRNFVIGDVVIYIKVNLIVFDTVTSQSISNINTNITDTSVLQNNIVSQNNLSNIRDIIPFKAYFSFVRSNRVTAKISGIGQIPQSIVTIEPLIVHYYIVRSIFEPFIQPTIGIQNMNIRDRYLEITFDISISSGNILDTFTVAGFVMVCNLSDLLSNRSHILSASNTAEEPLNSDIISEELNSRL